MQTSILGTDMCASFGCCCCRGLLLCLRNELVWCSNACCCCCRYRHGQLCTTAHACNTAHHSSICPSPLQRHRRILQLHSPAPSSSARCCCCCSLLPCLICLVLQCLLLLLLLYSRAYDAELYLINNSPLQRCCRIFELLLQAHHGLRAAVADHASQCTDSRHCHSHVR